MLTSFFGAHSFGGDAVFVDRLSRALLRRGHEVTVVYSPDAFEALRGDSAEAPYAQPEGLRVRPLRLPAQPFPLLLGHQLGQPLGMRAALQEALGDEEYDVLHFHNISLIGGPGILSVRAAGRPLRVMTAHEFWLVCERSVLWKNGRETCETPECVACSLQARRPPQWWRKWSDWQQELEALHLLLTPSASSARIHAERGLRRAMGVLPYFLGPDWQSLEAKPEGRPYFLFAGRLVAEKGVARLLEAMRAIPEADLRVAGAGAHEAELRAKAEGMGNVRFLGRLGEAALREEYAGALATVVPSEMVETFGYVALESMAVGTPVVVRDLGALPELVAQSGGGLVYGDAAGLVEALQRLLKDGALREELGRQARAAVREYWNEEAHVERYLELLRGVKPV